MGKIYTSAFKTLRGDDVSVEIWKTGSSGSASSLTLSGDEPVVIEYSQDSVFDELKLSTCSVKVITDEPLMDLWTGKLSDVELKVYRNDGLLWYGFLTPNVYSMPYDSKNNQLTLEFVDPLNAMSEVRFRRYDGMFFDTFEGYIEKALEKVGASAVVTDITGIPDDMGDVGCMQRNFIDESNDEKDGASTWQDVMGYIARYLNMTMLCMGDEVRLYDCVEVGDRTVKNLSDIGIAGSDGQLSVGEVYNKVTVVANNNPLDSAIPDVLSEEDFVAQESDPQYHSVTYYPDQDTYHEKGVVHLESTIEELYTLMNAAFDSKKWELSDKYSLTAYATKSVDGGKKLALNEDSKVVFSNQDVVPWGNMMQYKVLADTPVGGTSYDETDRMVVSLQTGHVTGSWIQRYSSVAKRGTTASVSWSKCLTLGGEGAKATLKSTACPVFVGQGGYFVLTVKYKMSYVAYPQSVIKPFEIDCDKTVDGVYLNMGMKCTLKVGDKYWNGEEWTEAASTFVVKHTCSDGVYVTGTEVAIDNEVDWNLGLNVNGEGALIALPEDEVLSGKVQFSIENMNENEQHIPVSYYHISELQLQYANASTVKDVFDMDEYDADVTYTNVVNDDYVKACEDVEFRINTYTTKAISCSYAMKALSGGGYCYVVPADGGQNQEQKFIKRMVKYYKTSKVGYNVTIEDMDEDGDMIMPWDCIVGVGSKPMSVLCANYDLMDNSVEVNLQEIIQTA